MIRTAFVEVLDRSQIKSYVNSGGGFVYKKLLLLVLALMFMAFSNLRVCCRLTVDGEAVDRKSVV